jgi:hypothetical protein
MKSPVEKYLKVAILFLGAIFYRLIPVRPPNVEPILSTVMPLSKNFSRVLSVLFPFASIVLYDFLTAGIGGHTWSVAFTYSAIGLASYFYFQRKSLSYKHTVPFTIYSILFFDIVTGLIIGPAFGSQTFMTALVGQIPFTLLHLMGGALFTLVATPAISKFLTTNYFDVLKVKSTKTALQRE